MINYDIIIPVAKKDISFVPRVIQYIRKNLSEADTVYIITSKNCFNYFNKKNIKQLGAVLVDENEMLFNLNFKRIYKILLDNDVHVRAGWYFQQFLKMGFAKTQYAKKYYLSWDADTLPLNHINFFEDGKPLFTMKYEYNKPYFDTLEKILDLHKIADFSFIAEHMMFDKDIMIELLRKIEQCSVPGTDWIEKILNACEDLENPCFSEFETYGTYVMTYYPDMYGYNKLNTFRAAGIIMGRHIDDYRLERMSLDLDTASFEVFDKPLFPYRFEYYKDIWLHRYKQLKGRSIKNIICFLIKKLKNKYKL